MNIFKDILSSEDAATSVEYAVMLGLIIGAILGSIGVLGQVTGGLWNGIEGDLDTYAW